MWFSFVWSICHQNEAIHIVICVYMWERDDITACNQSISNRMNVLCIFDKMTFIRWLLSALPPISILRCFFSVGIFVNNPIPHFFFVVVVVIEHFNYFNSNEKTKTVKCIHKMFIRFTMIFNDIVNFIFIYFILHKRRYLKIKTKIKTNMVTW